MDKHVPVIRLILAAVAVIFVGVAGFSLLSVKVGSGPAAVVFGFASFLWVGVAVVGLHWYLWRVRLGRLLSDVPPDAEFKGRCLYAEIGFTSPAVAYVDKDELHIRPLVDRERLFPLQETQLVREGRWINGTYYPFTRVFHLRYGGRRGSMMVHHPEHWHHFFLAPGAAPQELATPAH